MNKRISKYFSTYYTTYYTTWTYKPPLIPFMSPLSISLI